MRLIMETRPRFFSKPEGSSFFLFGARGTGKSTWCLQRYQDSDRIDLLAPDVLRLYLARPERLREFVLARERGSTIIIDEVQKAPELLSVVHSLMEEKLGYLFVLTGSSSRKLKRAGTDMLAGRALLRTMHPFMAAELEGSFSLDTALKLGMLPVVWDSEMPEDVLKSYVGTYLREEVMMEGLVRSLGDFSRFLEAVSFSHGQILNISNVARECFVGRKTVEGYISVLEDLLLASRLPVFMKRAKRATVKHPKFYLFDTGIYRSLRPRGPLDMPEEIGKAALEGLVHQHLRAWMDYGSRDLDLYYWRTRDGSEVDFVLYGEDGFWAIEVKNSGVIRSKDLNALKSFKKDYPECTPLLLYRGESPLQVEDIYCLHVEDFLKNLNPFNEMI
ncbi:MAG: AAA family ATPase [Candidatus Aegiribacteria sp.]|nr:AAA family ATPase [Candidatus Aegiribacteria sp.]MBD3295320.1 AAA family ATPase [Candidatus Fermentibacteria bacterium]